MRQSVNRFIQFIMNKSILEFDYKMYGEECPICFEIFDELEDTSLLCTLRCGHSYHKECLTNWLSKDNTCPNCRVRIK